jgi:signal peptidase I
MIFFKKKRFPYSLSRSKKTLKNALRLYRQKESQLGTIDKEQIQKLLTALQTAILQNDAEAASLAAIQLEEQSLAHMPRSLWDKVRDFVGTLLFTLMVAIAIRQMWFEPYSIPTGSMRPTLKEGDFLLVTKTDFGINTPLRTGHLYFDPNLVMRGSVVIFSGENMDITDNDTKYFYLIPGKKQYIKRMIGKPGDTLYFYGGEIYGVNSRGRDLIELRDPNYFKSLEHIPYIRFEGKVETPENMTRGIYPTATIYQMNQAVAKLSLNVAGNVTGEMIGENKIRNYSDLWGFKNYAMSRILTARQVKQLVPNGLIDIESGLLYLEINHHPSLQGGKLLRDDQNRFRPSLGTSTSILPLSQEHLEQVLAHMTTCRFIVKDNQVFRFGSGFENAQYRPTLPGVPDGTYEFQDGVAREVLFGNITKILDANHPLLSQNPAQIQTLYNFGFEWSNYYTPSTHAPYPSRYTYFRGGDLCLMGGPVMKKGDPFLTLFLKREYQKQSMSTSLKPYQPFDDAGAPISEDGTLDIDFIRKYGITIPENMYLVLGDNHSMSADSRQFGFVPEQNLRGSASIIVWPVGNRWGRIPQAISPHLTLPNLSILGLALFLSIFSYIYIDRKYYKHFDF